MKTVAERWRWTTTSRRGCSGGYGGTALDDATLTRRRVLDGGRARALLAPVARHGRLIMMRTPSRFRCARVSFSSLARRAPRLPSPPAGRALTVFVRNGPLMSLSRSVHAMCLLKVRSRSQVLRGWTRIRQQRTVGLHPQTVHLVIRDGVGINGAALERLVPVPVVVDDPPADVLAPERRPR